MYLFNSRTGYDDLTQGPAGAEYSKGYSNSSQTQAKSAASGPGKGDKSHTYGFKVLPKTIMINYRVSIGVSVTSSNSGVPDISGTVYNKTQVETTPVTSQVIAVFCFDILNECGL